jgi:serine/threonine-protein kinase
MNPHDLAPVLPGETLAGKYRVERVLGHGGMGLVVAARHLELDERVAIKFLLRKDDPAAIERFVCEARAAAKVKNEHVCRVYDVARLETGEPYMVMEYLDGVDLADRLRAEGRLPVADVARWMIDMCAALVEAHAIGIVHRDLKPANAFLTKRSNDTSTVKILDFGISKLPSSGGVTSTSALLGTPIYMSPEQVASARDVDHRTDIWSLGVIMYEFVSGKPPFAGDSLIQLSVKIREADVAPLRSGVAGFDEVVAKCLAKEREARWSSVGELAAALAPFAGQTSVSLAPPGPLAFPVSAMAKTLSADHVMPVGHVPGRASTPGGRATLEPLIQAKVTQPPVRKSLPRAAIALVVAGVGVAVAVRFASPQTTTTAAPKDGATPTVSTISMVSTSASAVVTQPSTSPSVASSEAPPAKAMFTRPRAPKVAVDAGVAAAATPTPSPTSSTFAPAASAAGPKKRALDRDDPYAH